MIRKNNNIKSPYLELLKSHLIDLPRQGQIEYKPLRNKDFTISQRLLLALCKRVLPRNIELCRKQTIRRKNRIEGRDWPARAYSMVGLKRLNNVENCVRRVIADNVPGDLIETGVWKGGTVILMRAILQECNITDRKVWVADSFEGLPKPNASKYKADKGDRHHKMADLAIDLETVQGNFRHFHLLDDQVKFLKGWFKDTLPTAPINQLAVLRLDGDMYESTMDALTHLYPKLSSGGYCIIDDWGAIPACKQAVMDYRKANNITDEIKEVDWTGVFWRKANA
jgi:O-methyltransferase